MCVTFAVLFVVGCAAWFVSTLGAGGGAIILLPAANVWLEPQQIAPTIALASMASSVQRVWLYRRDVVRSIVFANIPGLLLGALLGAWLLQGLDPRFASIAIAIFLVMYPLSKLLRWGINMPPARLVHFAVASFGTASLSAAVGAAGPLMNPVYLQSGVLKERMIGTKAASTLIMQLAKIAAYCVFGLLGPELWVLGLALGAGALLGNVLGKAAIGRMSLRRFENVVLWLLLASGLSILWRFLG